MSAHVLNTTTFTIRTQHQVCCEVVGISNALTVIESLPTVVGHVVFFEGNEGMHAKFFRSWAGQMNRLINSGTGWNGRKVEVT
jgi:hypothetical protein